MLAAPKFRTIKGVTIFPDDTVWYRFYPIAHEPSIRKDENGKPIFLLVKYAFSDEDREANPDLPPGGGYLNFDVQFEVPPDTLEEVREELQGWVGDEWERLRNGTPEERNRQGVKNTTEPPSLEFGTPTWTSGVVAMDAPQSEHLVNARVAEGPPSLLSGNVAVFNMDLTPAGATFMQRLLTGSDDEGGAELTPLQVSYSLGMWARLPKVRIIVSAESERIYTQVRKIMDGRGIDHCTTYDFAHTDLDTTTAHTAGMIDVYIDTGSGGLDNEIIEELRQYSLDLIQEMIEARFFSDSPRDSSTAEPPEATERTTDRNSKKYLRESYDEATMTLEFSLEQSSVVEWKIHPQATVEPFLGGMSAEELRNHVRVIDLDDDFFKNLELEVRAFADYDDPELSAVEVDVRYEGRDENGEHKQKNETFTFTSDEPQSWKPSLIGDTREYKYRYRIGFKDRGFGPYTDWVTTRSPDLNVSIPTPGRVIAHILAGDLQFDELVENVQVTLAYEDPEASISREEYKVVLTSANHEGHYERLIYDFQRQPLRYHTRFKLKSGEVIDADEWRETAGHQILINQPFEDVLRVRLLPAGDGWDEVAQVIVDLRYRDLANDYEVVEGLILKSREEFRTWQVVLRDKERRDFDYKVTASYKDGRLEVGSWKTGFGEQTIPIEASVPPRLRIQIVPDMLDFEAARVTEVTLHYDAAGDPQSETFIFRDNELAVWTIEVPDGAPVDYTYRVTHHPVGGDPVVLPEVRETDTVVVLQPYEPAEAGTLMVEVMSQLVDFTATPLVAVDLEYQDEVHDVNKVGSLVFDKKETMVWEISVPDITRKLYGYTITYFDADGNPHPAEKKYQQTPRIIIPKGPES